MEEMKVINEYPFNLLKRIFGEQGELKADKEKLTALMDDAFEKVKEFSDEEDFEEFAEHELVLSKSIPICEYFFKYGKTEEEVAAYFGVSKTVVHNGIEKVIRKLRYPKISKPLHDNIEWVGSDIK